MDEQPKKQTSKMAIVSWLCTIFPIVAVPAVMFVLNKFSMSVTQLAGWSIFLAFMLIFFAAVISAFIALKNINKNRGQLSGRPLAITSMVISILIICSVIFLMLEFHGIGCGTGCRLVCATNVKGLGTVFQVYANDFDGNLPTADSWCDLLVEHCDVSPKSFICIESRHKFKIGESAYALNENAAGLKLENIPGDMVLMFESKAGWNQVGGPELLSTENHDGEGCNILFGDGHAEFVRDLANLKWKVK